MGGFYQKQSGPDQWEVVQFKFFLADFDLTTEGTEESLFFLADLAYPADR